MLNLNRKYYYLVAGLPDIELEAGKRSFNFSKLMEEIKDGLHANDQKAIKELFLINDFFNYLYVLQNKKEQYNFISTYTLDELILFTENQNNKDYEEKIIIPDYFLAIRQYYLDSKDEELAHNQNFDYEKFVWELFLNRIVKKSKFEFIRKWYDFEQFLRNIQTAYLSRKKKIPAKEYLIGDAKALEPFLTNHSTDFGLKNEVETANEIFQALDINNIRDREFRLDLVRWNKLDELTLKDYFNIDKILSFIVKMTLLERWLQLDKQKGMALFENILKELKQQRSTI